MCQIILTPIKRTQSILKSSIAKIDAECCDENFTKKDEVAEIKNILQAIDFKRQISLFFI